MKYPGNMRMLHKKNIALVLLILVIFIITMGHNYSTYSTYAKSPATTTTRLMLSNWGSTNKEDQNTIYLHQPHLPQSFESLLKKYSINSLLELSKNERCDLYFNELSEENWSLPNFKDDFRYNIDIYNGKEYFNTQYNKLKKEQPEAELNTMVESIFNKMDSQLTMNEKIELDLLDGIYKFRTYATCYIGNQDTSYCNALDSKMFPWFSFKSPIYERWDGTLVNDYTQMRAQYPDETYKKLPTYNSEICFWNKFQNEMYGKGIVISISDRFVPDLVNLLKLLRFHQNKYPIQFVHKGDLSKESKQKLTEIARKTVVLQDSVTFDKFKQEIWFVDTQDCISEEYKENFESYSNKWLSVLFNTFEEMMLMDTDTAPYVAPEYFFKMPDYVEKGAFFFKDRYGIDSVHKKFPALWQKLFPSMMETTLFDVPQLTNHTLENDFFTKKSRHIMEAGIVLINRKSHLSGLLLSTQIQLWQPLTVKLHGEKDIFWLGQSMMGNEDYHFNTHFSGAAGILEENDFERSNLVISALPAHLDPYDNHTLLWLNSGLTYCKKNSWEKDAKEIFKDKISEEDLKKKYQSTIKINLLIVPPEVWKERDHDSNELDPELKEPKYSWRLRWDLGCSGYLWSAHSIVDDVKGLEIKYTEEETLSYDNIAKIWNAKILKVQE